MASLCRLRATNSNAQTQRRAIVVSSGKNPAPKQVFRGLRAFFRTEKGGLMSENYYVGAKGTDASFLSSLLSCLFLHFLSFLSLSPLSPSGYFLLSSALSTSACFRPHAHSTGSLFRANMPFVLPQPLSSISSVFPPSLVSLLQSHPPRRSGGPATHSAPSQPGVGPKRLLLVLGVLFLFNLRRRGHS